MVTEEKNQTIHFIGIGGIGVSALAKYYMSQGAKISGSDLVPSEITEELRLLGAAVYVGRHSKRYLSPDLDLVIFTPAVTFSNPEFKEAQARNIKIKSYPEVIGELTRRYKTITVSGAHGKSTTTAMAGLVLESGYYDPTVIVGAQVKEFGNSNFRRGSGSYLVLEADEWSRSFLSYHPTIAIVTNIDEEHLDTYGTISNIEEAFREYLKKIPASGVIIANKDDERVRKIVEGLKKRVIWYSIQDSEAMNMQRCLKIPGDHNVLNALAVLKLGRFLSIHEPIIWNALAHFRGASRRFELRGFINDGAIFNDYAHHPREIVSTIKAARARFPLQRIWCIFQPHQYKRLNHLWNDFIGAFDLADRVSLVPVWEVAGRDGRSTGLKINSLALTKELQKRGKNAKYLASFKLARDFIGSYAKAGDIILVMGAGNIYKLAGRLVDLPKNRGKLTKN